MINKPGSAMGKADALSRRPDPKEGVENDNETITLLKPEFFALRALQQGHLLIEGSEEGILGKVRKAKEMDEAVVKAVEELKRSPNKEAEVRGMVRGTRAGALQRKGLCAKDIQLRREIVRLHHDTPVAGHPG